MPKLARQASALHYNGVETTIARTGNVFSHPDFLSCLAEAHYPRRPHTILEVDVDDHRYRVLRVAPTAIKPARIVTSAPFLDFFEPIGASCSTARASLYIPRVSLARLSCDAWRARTTGEKSLVAPLIDFGDFPTWESFVTFVKARGDIGFQKRREQRERKLTRDHGVEYRWHDPDPDVREQLMAWKSQQYRDSGFVDILASPALRRFFILLAERGMLQICSMRVGDELVAAHAGLIHAGRFYYWLPAYDRRCGHSGIGSMLLEWMMAQAYARGLQEFDFLLGDEAYKFAYATDVRLVVGAGPAPLSQRVWQPLRERVMQDLRKYTAVHRSLQVIKRQAASLLVRA